jgi:hypothetical protein
MAAKATLVIIGLVIVGISLLVSTAKSARCAQCQHCRRLAQDDEAKRKNKRHATYHAYTDRAPSACDNDECPGRK